MVSSDKRWDFLAPWCAALKGRITYRNLVEFRESWETYYGLHVFMPMYSLDGENYRADFFKVREGLALLAAVEHVDGDAWKYLLKDCCEVDIGREGEQKYDTVPVRFWLELDLQARLSKDLEQVEYDLVKFCGVDQRQNASNEYVKALQTIAAMYAKLSEAGEDIEISVAVNFPGSESRPLPLHQLMDIRRAEREIKREWEQYAKSQERKTVERRLLRCTFALQPVVLDFGTFNNTAGSSETAATIERLVLDNVWISRIVSLSLRRDDYLNDDCASRKSMGQLMRRVFDSTRRSVDTANMPYRLDPNINGDVTNARQLGFVTVYGSYVITPTHFFTGMCSALMYNQMTEKIALSLEEAPDDFSSWYAWMAYGIFTKRARTYSSLDDVILTVGSMSEEDVAPVGRILASDHPEEVLCETAPGSVDERDATLKSGAPIRWNFNANGEPILDSPALTFPLPIQSVRTFSDDGRSEWVNVIVPGCGRCQVRRTDLTFYELVPPRDAALISLTIEFAVAFDPETSGMLRFIEAIGPSLKCLTIASPRTDLDENWLLQCCPNLVELSLCGGMFDVQLNFSEYRSSASSSLRLPSTNWHDIESVAMVLSDNDSIVSQCVRRLRVRLTNECNGWVQIPRGYTSRGFDNDLRPVLDTLDRNKSIEFLEIVTRESSGYDKHIGDFRKYHKRPIARVENPLSTERKIAFISIFKEPGEPDAKKRGAIRCVFRDLSQESLSSIFAFAATPVLQQVYFREERFGYGWDDGPDERLRDLAGMVAAMRGW